jgi:GDP/UDP-N,N'-diacetylbacillosamine 2-epimerase (hydrolysing)
MTIKKKIIAVTGIRSEYDILYPVLAALNAHQNYDLKVVVSGAHLSQEHGFTLERIIEDGFTIADCIDSLMQTERLSQRPKAVGSLISGLTQTVEREQPDFLLVVGDREESIATAIVGNYMEVLVAHIGGGDPVFGNADDPVRMAVSKLAHIHFSTTQQYADNLVAMGEDKWRIEFCGTPGLDNIANEQHLSLDEISQQFGQSLDNYLLVLKHPLSSEKLDAYQQMKITLEAVEKFCQENNFKAVVIQPNSDPGSADILRAMDDTQSPHLFYTKSLPRELFVNIVRQAKVLVGNSSMGILEAPMHKLPVVNVGRRQQGRLNAGNVEFVNYDENKIIQHIQRAAFNMDYRNQVELLVNPYGEGKTAIKIIDFLQKVPVNAYKKWHMKQQLVPGINVNNEGMN